MYRQYFKKNYEKGIINKIISYELTAIVSQKK